MALTLRVEYLGDLRCKSVHQQSGNSLISDAPLDNNGKGEAFSPTDLVATALASCMLTVMGIKARAMGFDLGDANAEVLKVMKSDPRRIGEINLKISLRKNCDEKSKEILEKTALNCPVAKSLSADLNQNISFNWL